MGEFIQALIIGSIFGFSGAALVARYGSGFGLLDRPNKRSSHEKPTPKGGGIGILFGFLILSWTTSIPWQIWLSAGVLAGVSLVGDRIELGVRFRLRLQFVVAAVWLLGNEIPLMEVSGGWLWGVGLWVFLVASANFYNFMDGINGIAGLTGCIGFGFLCVVGVQNQMPLEYLGLWGGLGAACLGFLKWNLPQARVFMGDVGSILLGFVYAGSVVILSTDWTTLLCLVGCLFPFYADELTTMTERWKAGESLTQAHRKHLYQILVNEGRMPHWKVSVAYAASQLGIGIVMLSLRPAGFEVVLGMLFLLSVGFVMLSRKLKQTHLS